ncbi:MAG: hypothetical protein ACRDO7_03495, partial [Nocardioidaceae bacterium]
MKNGLIGCPDERRLRGVALGIATTLALVLTAGAGGADAASAADGATSRAPDGGNKCYHSSQIYRCVDVGKTPDYADGFGYTADYGHGRNFSVAVSELRLQKW